MSKTPLNATALLIGTTVGAGIFGLPYAVSKIGFLPGIIYLLTLAALILLLNLIYGEIILRTSGDHQISGYASIYLGKTGKILAAVSLFIGLYAALWAYLIKIGEFLTLIFGGTPLANSLVFFLLAASMIFFGLRFIAKLDLVLVCLIFGFITLLTAVGFHHIQPTHLTNNSLSLLNLSLPFGIILFALTGYSAIPEMEEILRHDPKKLKNAIVAGSIIPTVVYAVFILVILGICGPATSEDAVSGLVDLPSWIQKVGALLGLCTMTTSFLACGYVLKETWFRDFRMPKKSAIALALLPPFALFLSGTESFIAILGFAGAITGGLTGILILLMYKKAKKHGTRQPSYSIHLSKLLWLAIFAVFLLALLSPFIQ